MLDDFRPINTVPRDGTVVELMDPDVGSFLMRWNIGGTNPLVSKEIGIWECIDGSCTWCEDDGMGPRYWRPARPVPTEGGRHGG